MNVKRIIAIICSLSISVGLMSSSVLALESEQSIETVKANVIFEEKLNSIQTDTQLNVAQTKPLKDFAGNNYTLIEADPIGYMIYHDASGLFVEYAQNSPSPYSGYTGDLYYGGPTEYFIKTDDGYQHTILDEVIPDTDIDQFIEVNTETNARFLSTADTSVLNYIYSDINSKTPNIARASYNYVPSYPYISALRTANEFGYKSGDYCTYIAANILLFYLSQTKNSDFVASSMISSTNGKKHLNGNLLTNNLINIGAEKGYSNTITAIIMDDILKTYCSRRGISISTTTTAIPLTSTMVSNIQKGKPTLLSGAIRRPGTSQGVAHSVLVYGYTQDSIQQQLICHYGWENYSDVTIDGAWGASLVVNI